MIQRITSHSNPTIKGIGALREKKHRRTQVRFLAEGLRICAEAVEAGHIPKILVFAEEARDHALVQRLTETVDAAGGMVIETSHDILHKLTGKDNPQAVLGVFATLSTELRNLDRFAAPMWVVAEALKDPGNLGTILRTCDATGAGGLILLDASADPFSVEAVRASMGALFTRTVVQTDGPSFFRWLRDGPGMLVGASLEGSMDYQSVRYEAPTFVMMGNEQSGLPPAYAGECDALVRMPMMGKADSLNVAVATAVLLYEVLNQSRVRS